MWSKTYVIVISNFFNCSYFAHIECKSVIHHDSFNTYISSAAFSRIGNTKDKGRLGTATLDSALSHHNGGLTESRGDLINSSVQGLKRVALYVLGEKAQMKVSVEANACHLDFCILMSERLKFKVI